MSEVSQIIEDRQPPLTRRVYLDGFGTLDPLAIPWRELRRSPEAHPGYHVAKVSSARTVVGFTFQPAGGEPGRIYLKRSIARAGLRRLLASVRAPKEWREFQIARRFAEAGIRVPEPVYFAEGLDHDGCRVAFLATRAMGDPWQSTKKLFKSIRTFGAEWESLAVYTRNLHDRRLFHADYRSDHVFLDPGAFARGEADCWALMDLDGSECGRPVTAARRRKAILLLVISLRSSGIGQPDVARFLRLYDPENRHHLDAESLFNEASRARR